MTPEPERKPFAVKLFSPRPSFHLDMTDAERDVMQRHVTYWRGLLEQDIAFAFGPVLDPECSWGIALFETESDEQAEAIVHGDPAFQSGMREEFYPMGALVHA